MSYRKQRPLAVSWPGTSQCSPSREPEGVWAGPPRAVCHLRPEALPHCSTAEGLKDRHRTEGQRSPRPNQSKPSQEEIHLLDVARRVGALDLTSTLTCLARPPRTKAERAASLGLRGCPPTPLSGRAPRPGEGTIGETVCIGGGGGRVFAALSVTEEKQEPPKCPPTA